MLINISKSNSFLQSLTLTYPQLWSSKVHSVLSVDKSKYCLPLSGFPKAVGIFHTKGKGNI